MGATWPRAWPKLPLMTPWAEKMAVKILINCRSLWFFFIRLRGIYQRSIAGWLTGNDCRCRRYGHLICQRLSSVKLICPQLSAAALRHPPRVSLAPIYNLALKDTPFYSVKPINPSSYHCTMVIMGFHRHLHKALDAGLLNSLVIWLWMGVFINCRYRPDLFLTCYLVEQNRVQTEFQLVFFFVFFVTSVEQTSTDRLHAQIIMHWIWV